MGLTTGSPLCDAPLGGETDLSRYGLVNAVTCAAEDVVSYGPATEGETTGFRFMELPKPSPEGISGAKPLALSTHGPRSPGASA